MYLVAVFISVAVEVGNKKRAVPKGTALFLLQVSIIQQFLLL
ncbi:MAG: hypothetical protein ACI92I_000157 [Acidimicrobiales bacterium]|jgi:hypothetical protein